MRGINLSFRYSCEATDDAKEPGRYMPAFSNISFDGIRCDDVEIGISLDGIPGGKMENIYLNNVNMTAEKCITGDSVFCLNMKNVNVTEKSK